MKRSTLIKAIENKLFQNWTFNNIRDEIMSEVNSAFDEIKDESFTPENTNTSFMSEVLMDIVSDVALIVGEPVNHIRFTKKKMKYVIPRRVFIFYLKRAFGNHFLIEDIRDFISADNHTTVLHAIKLSRNHVSTKTFNEEFVSIYNKLLLKRKEKDSQLPFYLHPTTIYKVVEDRHPILPPKNNNNEAETSNPIQNANSRPVFTSPEW